MTYPDTTLRDDIRDLLYGGRPALEFGGLAWQWACNVLDVLEAAHLAYNRQPYRQLAPITQDSVSVGDVVLVDLAAAQAGGGYTVRKPTPGDIGDTTKVILGVVGVQASAGRRCNVLAGGIIPRAVSGFSSLAGGQGIAVDYTLARLAVASFGDTIVGFGDANGNVLLSLGL